MKETKLQMIIERSIDGNKPRNELDLIHATENKSFIRSADQACQNRSELELEYHTKYIHSYSGIMEKYIPRSSCCKNYKHTHHMIIKN